MNEENKDSDLLFIWNAIKDIFKAKFQDLITSDILSMFEAKKTADNHCKALEFKDINNKLSEDAQNAILDVKGPLKGENFLKLLLDDILDKPCKQLLPIIRRYSDDVDGVSDQMSDVIQIVEKRMEYRKKQEKMDIKLIKKCKEIKEAVEKEKKSSKTQRSMDEFLTPKITNINEVGKAGNKKTPYLKKQLPPENLVSEKQAKKRNKKRKIGISENGISAIASKIDKRLRITSSENSIESMSLGEPEEFNDENTDPMSLADSEESCSQHNEPMSVCSSEGSLSDAMSIDEPREIINAKKLLKISKTSSKKVGKVLENDSTGSRKNETTVSEIGFYLRGGRLR